jgi:hypothetical protein
MTRRIVHASARSKDRVPAGRVKALCGQVVPRREAPRSGATCPMCQAVAANTAASTAATSSGAGGRRGGER